MSEQTQPIELEHSKEKKQPLYYKKIDAFEKHWNALGRKIMVSERMLYFHKDITDQAEIRQQYCKKIADLICILDHNMFEPKSDNILTSKFGVLDNETAFEQFKERNLNNPKYTGKYVAFVNGKLEGMDEIENRLVKKIYNKFGNVEMFVGKVVLESESHIIDTPELG